VNKKKVYERLQDDFFLPPSDCRGVTHAYLAKVAKREVFTVGRHDIARFLADLKPHQLKRAPHCCRYEAFFKLEGLLKERGLQSLGFDDDQIPDGGWLYPVLRYVDQENLSGVFSKALKPVADSSTNSDRLFMLQQEVGQQLLEANGLGKRPAIRDSLEELWLANRKATGKLAEVAAATNNLSRLQKQSTEAMQEVREALEKATAVVYLTMAGKETEQSRPEHNEDKERVHDALKLMYTVDCVLRRDGEVALLAQKFAGSEEEKQAREDPS
jgi:hypothetical protein